MLRRVAGAVAIVYFLIAALLMPNFERQYAAASTTGEWLLLGRVAPALMALIWPYYVSKWTLGPPPLKNPDQYTVEDLDSALDDLAKQPVGPDMTTDELDRLSRIMSRMDTAPFTDDELGEIRKLWVGFKARTGRGISRADYILSAVSLALMNRYMMGITESALLSWDNHQLFETSEYREARATLLKRELRRPELFKNDEIWLRACARNASRYVNADGDEFSLARSDILARRKSLEVSQANMKRYTGIMKDCVDK